MGLNRGSMFVGILLALLVILTMALAAAVYKETPALQQVADNNSSGPGDMLLGGSAPAEFVGSSATGQEPYIDPIVGKWQESGTGDIYSFDGTKCTINDDPERSATYYKHKETVWTHSNTPYTTTIYSFNGDPGEGYGFVDGKLYFMVWGNTRWEVWYELTNIYRPTPIEGTWRLDLGNGGYYPADDGWRFTFDDSNLYITIPNQDTYQTAYHKSTTLVHKFYTQYDYDEYYLPAYLSDEPYGGIDVGYTFIGGELYELVDVYARTYYITFHHMIKVK